MMTAQTKPVSHPDHSSHSRDPAFVSLTDGEREALRSAMAVALASGFDRHNTEYAKIVGRSALPLEAIGQRVFASRVPYCVIRNLPVERLAENWEVGRADMASAVLVGLTHALGLRHFGYREEKAGAILQDVHPIAGWENTLSNAGRVKFNLHVESPFLPRVARPEAAALIALNNDAATATRVGVVERINEALPSHVLETLRSPIFSYRHDDSFKINGYTLHTPPSPFLKRIDGFEESRCAIFTQSSSVQGEQALAAWMAAAEAAALDIVLHPGDMLIFNNHRCIHGRGSVEGKRWLKRVYGSRASSAVDADDLVSVWSACGAADVDHSF